MPIPTGPLHELLSPCTRSGEQWRACHSSTPARTARMVRSRTAARTGVSAAARASDGAGASIRWQCSTAARGSPGTRRAVLSRRARSPARQQPPLHTPGQRRPAACAGPRCYHSVICVDTHEGQSRLRSAASSTPSIKGDHGSRQAHAITMQCRVHKLMPLPAGNIGFDAGSANCSLCRNHGLAHG